MSVETDLDHWTIVVRANSTVKFHEYNPELEKSTHLHVTQAALGVRPIQGRHVVMAGRGVIGTLEMGRCEQFGLDLIFTSDTNFSVVGPSEVHLSGYTTTSSVFGPDGGPSDDEEVPVGVPLFKDAGLANGGAHRKPQEHNFSSMDEEGSSSDEDEDDDDEPPAKKGTSAGRLETARKQAGPLVAKGAPPENRLAIEARNRRLAREEAARAKAPASDEEEDDDDDDDDDDEEDDDDDDDDEGGDILIGNEEGEDDEDDEEEDSDEGVLGGEEGGETSEEDEDEYDEEEEEEEAAGKGKAGVKRPAVAPAKSGPQPSTAKKAKKESKPTNGKAPAKGSASPPGAEAYAEALKEYISKNGPSPLGVLGGKVKRPANIPKLKRFVETHKDFRIDDKGVVTVA